METSATRILTCRACKTRYDSAGLTPGSPFSCKHCGEVLFTPNSGGASANRAELPFGQVAVKLGFITAAQLSTVLQEHQAERSGLRLGDLLVKKRLLNGEQVRAILKAQGARVAQLIPGYEIIEKLGEGGMGAVYKGVHIASRKTVAIKVLGERLASRKEFLERFHREARVAIDLDHEHIAKGFDEGCAADSHYFVMEYIHGKSAGRVLKRRGRFGERRALDIGRQVAAALRHAHERRIVHRDIKPDNIMLTRDGRAKLADYGLVKYADDLGTAGLTAEGQIMGTPNYLSPEQGSGRGTVDIRSDIYSLGATLYHMITGRTPYVGPSALAIVLLHASAPAPDPKSVFPGISAPARALLLRMMAKKPEDRFQTPAEALSAIEACLASKSVPPDAAPLHSRAEGTPAEDPWDGEVSDPDAADDSPSRLMASAFEEEQHLSRLAPILLGIGVFVLVLALIATLLLFRSERPAAPPPRPAETAAPEATPPASTADRNLESLHAYAAAIEGLRADPAAAAAALREVVQSHPGTPGAKEAEKKLKELGKRKP